MTTPRSSCLAACRIRMPAEPANKDRELPPSLLRVLAEQSSASWFGTKRVRGCISLPLPFRRYWKSAPSLPPVARLLDVNVLLFSLVTSFSTMRKKKERKVGGDGDWFFRHVISDISLGGRLGGHSHYRNISIIFRVTRDVTRFDGLSLGRSLFRLLAKALRGGNGIFSQP